MSEKEAEQAEAGETKKRGIEEVQKSDSKSVDESRPPTPAGNASTASASAKSTKKKKTGK
ncbi:hypothetical protein CC1G_15102 [Coprinopsis cinerea okayama7|uniref:Uncharacterized protein n=1 Tax=Coprinopsis cinerea (strain Okayama-7 / 130 / ATCC MYA-4618 / FGSC 9003) TaxID=240176 RepID=D6RPG4_COPC7|nr:hypothetical protein CC1G_15102 [Coprinopsis cinerea okayama7\|eukprot:XP_002910461.1 hypothetical protein CC1G_15102 [Coprinopsis cinerea okayama7\